MNIDLYFTQKKVLLLRFQPHLESTAGICLGLVLKQRCSYKNLGNGVAIFGGYNGVRVGIKKTNRAIEVVFPDTKLILEG
ncbi:hypothetical protein HOO54_12700 [Bacillus sp. WMMC1349]|uniref:hypothetical protein n=1 Tax=Bacillus sp. WMMC1349 TaxID=2736254 RepID=UPI0015545AC3|nr:hypothetical protein [Bacillus sp. WMMC1349]NPC93067.1 hypothetical protein [Bacillus sp. WMMC1349]